MNTVHLDAIVYTQASLLVTALRKAMPSSRPLADDPNVHTALAMLESLLSADPDHHGPKVILAPFLECLKSHEISGPLVLLIVDSIYRLVKSGCLEEGFEGRQEFLLTICKSLNQTRFEATDLGTDEVALFQLLTLMQFIIDDTRPWHVELSDGALVAAFETMLSLLIPRFSDLLKATSETALVALTGSLFKRFHDLKRMDEDGVMIQIPGRKGSVDAVSNTAIESNTDSTVNSPIVNQTITSNVAPFTRSICDAVASFIGRVIQNSDKKAMERLVPVALKMAMTMMECGQEHLFEDTPFMKLIDEPIIKELIRTFGQQSGLIGDLTNSIVLLLFYNHRHYLHGHYVFFMNHLMSLLRGKVVGNLATSPVRPARPAHRDAVLELLLATGKHVERSSCKKAVLILHNITKHVADGCIQSKSANSLVGQELSEKYAMKVLHAKAAQVFNNKPKDIEAFLVENGLLPAEHSREDLARQVRRINGLHKKRLGEWLAKPGNEDLAKAFIADLDFNGRRIDEALRLMLATFRLPGESQEINRIMEAFAPVLYEQCRSVPSTRDIFASPDSVYIMAYSVIMLNTDQHNPQYKGRRMTEEDFIRNNRGNNEGKDYDHDFLRSVYHSIRTDEILMPDEHEGDTAFNYRYSDTVNTARIYYCGPRLTISVDTVGAELLPMIWDAALKAMSDLFELQLQVLNDQSVSRAALGTLQCLADAAGSLNQPDRMDELIMSLWQCSNLEKYFKSTSGNVVPRYLAKAENGRGLVQLMVDIFKRHGEVIRTGWKQLVDLVFILHESKIISSESFAGQPNGDKLRKSSSDADSTIADAENVVKVSDFMSSVCHLQDIFLDSRLLSDDALSALLSAFLSLLSTTTTMWSRSTKALSIDICIYCALQNRDRLCMLWRVLFGVLSEVSLRGQDEVLREHAVVGLGRLALKMAEREEEGRVRADLISFLQFLCNLAPDAFDRVAEPILAIILKIVELDSLPGRSWTLLYGDNDDLWPSYFTIMSLVGRKRQCAPYTLGLLMAATDPRVQFPVDFYTEYLDLMSSFISACHDSSTTGTNTTSNSTSEPLAVDMAKMAIKRLCDLESSLAGKDFTMYTVPIHCILAMQCQHSSRDIRQHALLSLQRLVLSHTWPTNTDLVQEFETVLFGTLLDPLLSDHIMKLNGTIEDTQMAAASFVTKVFLNNLPCLQQGDPLVRSRLLLTLLQKLLQFLRFRSDTLLEGIPETIKNVLFVLKTTCKESVPEETWRKVWDMTEQVLPDLQRDLGMTSANSDTVTDTVNVDMIAPAASPSAVHFV